LNIDHNFGKCTPISKICSLTDFQGNSLCNLQGFHLTLTMLLHYHAKFKKIIKTVECLPIPSKLISFTPNLTKLNNI